MHNNYLRNSIIGLLFITPFVGLFVDTSLFFPYITGKNLAFRAFIEIAFALYLILALKNPSFRPRLNAIVLSFTAFLAIIFAADIFGIYPFKSFWSNFERMEGFITHLHLFAYFIMLSAVFTGEKIWSLFFQTSLGVSVIMGLVAANQDGRVSGMLGNSSYLGIYMLFHIFIAGLLLVRVIERKGDYATKWMKGLAYGFVILFDFYVLFNTGTRGAFLGMLAGAFVTAVAFAIWEKNKALKWIGRSALILIVFLVGSLAFFKESNFVKSHDLLARFSQLATFNKAGLEQFATTQGKSRFGIWGIAYEGFKENPVLGWGQDNFNYVFNTYYDPKIYDQEQWFDRAHNVFFDWLIAGGALGLISYLALFVSALLAIWKSKAHEKDLYFLFSDKVLLTALLLAYFIHNLFVFDSLTSYLLFFAVLAFITIHDRKVFVWHALSKPIRNEGYLQAATIVIVIAGCVSFYYFTIAPYRSSSTIIAAVTYQSYALANQNAQAYKATFGAFDKALSYDSIVGISEVREQLLQGASSAIFNPNTTAEVRSEYFKKAQEEMVKQFDTTPPDARYYLFYGSFLSRLGVGASSTEMTAEGLTYLKKAHELSPRKQTILFELGSAAINSDRFAEATGYFKEAFDYEPAFSDARFLYALSLVYAKNNKLADEIIKPLSGTAYPGDYRLLKAYFDTKQNDKLNIALRYKLDYAKSLATNGNAAAAIKELKDLIDVSPAFKPEADKLLQQLQVK